MIENSKTYRAELDKFINEFPELFPDGIENGYHLKEARCPKKSQVPIRRIIVISVTYTVRPAFVMPYHTAFTKEVEKA